MELHVGLLLRCGMKLDFEFFADYTFLHIIYGIYKTFESFCWIYLPDMWYLRSIMRNPTFIYAKMLISRAF